MAQGHGGTLWGALFLFYTYRTVAWRFASIQTMCKISGILEMLDRVARIRRLIWN
jgi:hypothetical protein